MNYDCSVTNRKGCNYCLKSKPLSQNEFEDVTIYDYDGKDESVIILGADSGSFTISVSIKINYCPICGRKLK